MTLWNRWVVATSATEDATPVALFRIAMGLCVLISIGSVVNAGLVEVIWVDHAFGGVRHLRGNWLVQLLGGANPSVIWTLVLAAGLSGFGLILGLGGRLTAVLALLTTQALVDINSHAGGSYDQLLQNGLWLTVLVPNSHTLSVDQRLRSGSWVNLEPIGAWCRWLIAFQIVLVYTSTGWQKLSASWTPGGDFSALYYILQQPSWQIGDMRWLAHIFPITQLATAISWWWEVSNPLWLLALFWSDSKTPWKRRFSHLRWVYLALGVIFHISILFTMNVGPFGPISLAFYVALLRPAELTRLLRRPAR